MLKTTSKEYFTDYSLCFWIRNPLILDLDKIPRRLTNNKKRAFGRTIV